MTGDSKASKKIQKQVQKLGLADTTGFPDLGIFSEPVLVMNQKGKLVELRAEFAIFDRYGRQLAAVRGKRMSSRMTVIDMLGRTLLDLRREHNILGARHIVTHGDGRKVGRILHSRSWNQIDRAFKIEGPENEMIGGVYREDRGRHRSFNVQDADGHVVASISKTRAGLAKELFTKGDNYVVEFQGIAAGPLRSLSITAALIIDAAYHQNYSWHESRAPALRPQSVDEACSDREMQQVASLHRKPDAATSLHVRAPNGLPAPSQKTFGTPPA